MGNYRPISILSVFSKVFEKILHNRLSSFSDRHGLLNAAQFGFRKHLSTETALLVQKEFILENFENRKLVLGVFIDFTKAFDCLNHSILLQKLERYGFRGRALTLLSSYLKHRHQYVHLSGFSSLVKPITSGVPQGSILGPLLFNIYVNDIVNIDKEAKLVMYADDTSLFFSADEPNLLISLANKTLSKLNAWANENSLKINTSKTKAIMFRPKNKEVSYNTSLILNASPIDIVCSFKTLGVLFSENMSWDCHVNHVISKLSCIVGLVNRNRSVLPISVRYFYFKRK